MSRREPTRPNRSAAEPRYTEAVDLLKEIFVCVSIPIVAFSFAYITLDTVVRLFLE